MLKDLLKEKDLHAAQLARRIGVDRSTVSKWSSGKLKPKEKYLSKISEVLNVSVEEVIKCFEESEKESV